MTAIIFFDPLQQTVSSHAGVVSLNRQSSMCLAYLLKREGAYVSKALLIEECWGPKGVVVSEGSVRQVLFMLRRAFNQLGAPENTLTTRPKVGYQLKAGIVQLKVNPGHTLSDTPDDFMEAQLLQSPAHEAVVHVRSAGWKKYLFLFSLLLVAGLLGATLSLRHLTVPVEYVPLEGNFGPDIHAYVQRGIATSPAAADLDAIMTWRRAGLISFPPEPWIYVNRSEPQNASFFVCDKPLGGSGGSCFSVTGIGRAPHDEK